LLSPLDSPGALEQLAKYKSDIPNMIL